MCECRHWRRSHFLLFKTLFGVPIPPRNTPDSFCRRFTRQNHRCAAWVVFFFFTNKILCSCSIFQNLFLVVDSTTAKCYSCVWKKQNVVSSLRPVFFIQYLESYINRLNVIPCHDLTLSVSEPDNAAAQTEVGTSFGSNGNPITWAESPLLIFCVLTIRKHLLMKRFERSGRGQR